MSNNEFSSFPEVFDMLGVKYNPHKVEVKLDCPDCGHHALFINLNKARGKCFHCDKTYNYQTYYMAITGVDSKTAYKEIMSHYHRENVKSYVPKKVKEAPQAELRPIDERNEKYRAFIEALPLSERHAEDLVKRGVKRYDLERIGYKTLSGFEEEATKVKFLKDNSLSELIGIGGFYRNKKGEESFKYFKECITVPYINRNRLMGGIQLRINDEEVKTKDDSKYIWFSSKNVPDGCTDGCTSGVMVHYATMFYKDFSTDEILPLLSENVRVTEGAMKGDLIHYFTGEPVLCIPGVNCASLLIEEFQFLKSKGVKRIVDTFDMDYITNDKVQKYMDYLKQEAEAAGLEYVRYDWDKKYKGYDDYLANQNQNK